MKFLYSNIMGCFVIDNNMKVLDKIIFKNTQEYKNKKSTEEKLIKKYKKLEAPNEKFIKKTQELFKDKKYFPYFYKNNLELTKNQIRESINTDNLVVQTVNSISEITKASNILVTRLREWFELENPEFSEKVKDNEKFVELIIKKDIKTRTEIGANLSKEDLKPISELAKQINSLYSLKNNQEDYLKKLVEQNYPNITIILGYKLAAALLEHAGSLKKLSQFPASTIQLLGAEKALFRHLKNKKNLPPRHGLIVQHPFLASAPQKLHGKIARLLGDKVSIATKVDYFKGKFIGDKLKKEIEAKIKKLK